MSHLQVISQHPPGGRCTLYARYANAISSGLEWNHQVVHSDYRGPHGEGFPSLLVSDTALRPSDGVMLSPEDICAHLTQTGVSDALVAELQSSLEAILSDFLEKLAG